MHQQLCVTTRETHVNGFVLYCWKGDGTLEHFDFFLMYIFFNNIKHCYCVSYITCILYVWATEVHSTQLLVFLKSLVVWFDYFFKVLHHNPSPLLCIVVNPTKKQNKNTPFWSFWVYAVNSVYSQWTSYLLSKIANAAAQVKQHLSHCISLLHFLSGNSFPLKGVDTLFHSLEWESVSTPLTGTVSTHWLNNVISSVTLWKVILVDWNRVSSNNSHWFPLGGERRNNLFQLS